MRSDARMGTGECYMCCGEGAPRSPCSCVDRYVHLECQRQQWRTIRRADCTVCLTPFQNAESVVEKMYVPYVPCCVMAAILVCYVVFMFCFCCVSSSVSSYLEAVVVFSEVAVVASLILVCMHAPCHRAFVL